LENIVYFCTQNSRKMNTATVPSHPVQMIVTLEDTSRVADIRKALMLIRGIASVRMARISDDRTISPALRASIKKAREESARGETIVCNSPEEMQQYFDSL
jgi:hypothetical protein